VLVDADHPMTIRELISHKLTYQATVTSAADLAQDN
tara:strand:+ start:757 stop:864 length:108 start_codon:yes stop_codon:yes gene_type:complete